MIFPAGRTLTKPEDGVALADGRLVVSDRSHGLRLLELDGSSRPFGNLQSAGYMHQPPRIEGGANGVALEPDGGHVLMCDVLSGGIYRVEVATETSSCIYRHKHGINAVWCDRRGGVWYTQSSQNTAEQGQAGLHRTLPFHHGSLWYLPPAAAQETRTARELVDALNFANGLVLDEKTDSLYVAETLASKVWRFRVDVAAGTVDQRELALDVSFPDNITLDRSGRLWIASSLRSEIVVFDPRTRAAESFFRIATPAGEALIAGIEAKVRRGEPFPFDEFTPVAWQPAPGMLTGVILSPDEKHAYVTTLGDALIRLPC
jgi:sugar lactone lactonase YvrE